MENDKQRMQRMQKLREERLKQVANKRQMKEVGVATGAANSKNGRGGNANSGAGANGGGDKKNRYQQLRQQNEKARLRNEERRKMLGVSSRAGEVTRAQRLKSHDVVAQASQHHIGVPVNKSRYNGTGGRQLDPKLVKNAPRNPDAVRVVALGGHGEIGIGKNMTMIEYKDEIVIIDMGVLFANHDYPGVNYLTASTKYLEDKMDKVKAILFTHAHLDHIGGTRHILPRFNPMTPVYATEFTVNMIKKQMSELPEPPDTNYQVVDPFAHKEIKLSQHLSVEFVHVLHSIPGAAALVIRTPNGVILHMGDWRFENNPVGKEFDLPRLEEIAKIEGIAMLINESTNIDSPGTHPYSEFDVGENMGRAMDRANGRLIVSCFSSQVVRMQFVLDEAAKRGKKVAFAGFSMINNVEVALRSRQIRVPKDTVMKMEDIVKVPDEKAVIVCTGSQGELNAVLNRMVSGEHRHIKIKPTDTIVFSSNPIPGNEPHVTATVSGLMREGAEVIQNGKGHIHGLGPLHISGHAYFDDHVKLVSTLKPKNYLPTHGEYYMLEHNAQMAENVCGIPKERILVIDCGDIVELDAEQNMKKAGRMAASSELWDDAGHIVSEAVVKDRIHVSTEGIFVVVLTFSRKTGKLIKSPDVISRAFIYIDDSEELIGKVRHYIRTKTEKGVNMNKLDALKSELKDDVAHILFDATGRTPIILIATNYI
ncbi:ribonuclease J [Candidatus Saccharibacteria bacterium]|nr:ribonuclease J [Candidatus Saccharibacteria bacterium]